MPFFPFSFTYSAALFRVSLAVVTWLVSLSEKFSIENKMGRMSSFSFVVNGSFYKNWIIIDLMCFRCSSTSTEVDAPAEPQLLRP